MVVRSLPAMRSKSLTGMGELRGRWPATASLESHEPTPVTCPLIPAAPYTTCCTPAPAAASATLRPCRTSASRLLVIGFCTLKTP